MLWLFLCFFSAWLEFIQKVDHLGYLYGLVANPVCFSEAQHIKMKKKKNTSVMANHRAWLGLNCWCSSSNNHALLALWTCVVIFTRRALCIQVVNVFFQQCGTKWLFKVTGIVTLECYMSDRSYNKLTSLSSIQKADRSLQEALIWFIPTRVQTHDLPADVHTLRHDTSTTKIATTVYPYNVHYLEALICRHGPEKIGSCICEHTVPEFHDMITKTHKMIMKVNRAF